MSTKKIITTGINGLVGSAFRRMYGEQYEIVNLGLDEGERSTDITDLAEVERAVQVEPEAEAIMHLAAFTNVNEAFAQTGDRKGLAYKVNVEGTRNMVEMAKSYGKKLILVSTAYVFDGAKTCLYTETDEPAPIEWYGQTKRWAEEEVLNADLSEAVILRIDQPFGSIPEVKPDLVQRIVKGMKTGTLYPQFNNHYFGPTYIDDFARVMDFFLRRPKLGGIYHASSGEQWTDYDFAELVKRIGGLDYEVKVGDLEAYLASSERPYQRNTAMSAEKLRGVLDFKLQTIEQAVAAVQF